MRGKIVFLILLSVLQLHSTIVRAQTAEELESCFAYYDYGQLQTNLATEKSTYTPADTVKIIGTIVYTGRAPLSNVTLYAQLRRLNEQTHTQNGHHLIDRLTLAQNLSFLPGETKALSVELPLSSTYPNGQYQLHYYFFTPEGFHYAGRPFLEEDTAGYSTFTIRGSQNPSLFFDLNSLAVNGSPQTLRGAIVKFSQTPLRFSVQLSSVAARTQPQPVTVSWYSFEDSLESALLSRQQLTIPPGSQTVETVFTPPYPGAFVMLLEMNTPVRSLLKYRFAYVGNESHALRMNDLGITNFPVDQSSDRAYVCFHSPTNSSTPTTTVTLALLDEQKNILAAKTITRVFASSVSAISLPLTQLTNPKDVWVRATFSQADNPALKQEVLRHFTCETFTTNQREVGVSANDSGKLSLSATNVCGQALSQGYVEQIHIVQDGKIVDEAYNVTDFSKPFPQKPLLPGRYEARVRTAGKEQIVTLGLRGKKTTRINPWMTSGIIAFIISAVILYWWRRDRQKPEVQ